MLKTMKSKLIGAGMALALVGSTLGGVATIGATSAGAQTSPPPVAETPVESPEAGDTTDTGIDTPEPDDTADAPEADEATEQPEANEPNEPQLPGGGHADDGPDAQHEFEGIE